MSPALGAVPSKWDEAGYLPGNGHIPTPHTHASWLPGDSAVHAR